MATYQGAPGASVIEMLSTAPATSSAPASSTIAFIGEHWQGPSGVAIYCTSWAQFVDYFGGFNPNTTPVLANPYLAYAVYSFFLNGGQQAIVQRVTPASVVPGTNASVVLADSSASPQPTLKLTVGFNGVVGNIGTWGNNLHYAISAQPTAGRFNLYIYHGAVVQANLVETWNDLSMVKTDARYAPSLINAPTGGSSWVVATDLNDAASFPTNAPAAGTGSFSGGSDCGDPQTADWIAAVTYGAAAPYTAPLDLVNGALTFAIPGMTTSAIVSAAITYANTRPYTFLVLDPPSGETPAQAVSYFGTLTPVVSNAGLYAPWLVVQNAAVSNINATILTPPSGSVLGQMASIDAAQGVWVAPAGLKTKLAGVAQAERVYPPADLATLNNSNVNALRTLPNGNVVIWGSRTLQSGYSSLYVPVRRTLNYIEASLVSILDNFVFDPNDQSSWSTIVSDFDNFLSGLLSANAFAGNTPATSYYIICDTTNNTPQTIAAGQLNVDVGLALLYPIEFITLTLSQFQSTGTTSLTSSI